MTIGEQKKKTRPKACKEKSARTVFFHGEMLFSVTKRVFPWRNVD